MSDQPPYPPPPGPTGQYQPGGYPGPYGYPAQPPPKSRSGLTVAALVLGVFAVLLFWTVIGGVVLGIAALVLGIIALVRARRQETRSGMAVAGLVLGLIGLILAIAFAVVGYGYFKNHGGQDYIDCLRKAGNDKSAQQHCRDQFQHTFDNQP